MDVADDDCPPLPPPEILPNRANRALRPCLVPPLPLFFPPPAAAPSLDAADNGDGRIALILSVLLVNGGSDLVGCRCCCRCCGYICLCCTTGFVVGDITNTTATLLAVVVIP